MCASAALVLSVTSCYDDDSTLATNTINGVTIDADNSSTLYVGYQEQLDLTPTINRGTASDTVGLQYKWEIALTSTDNNSEMMEIGNESELHAIISNAISTQPYYLRLTVTDTANGDLQYTKLWQVMVQSSFLDGLLVSDTHDGSTSDLNLIMNKDLTLNYGDKAGKVFYNILENANGSAFDQLITKLAYRTQGYVNPAMGHTNNVWAITADGDAAIFNAEAYSMTSRLSEDGIITYLPEGTKALNFFSAGQFIFLNTNKYIYAANGTNSSDFGWYDQGASLYTIDNGVVMNATNWNIYYQIAIWFDANKGAFVYADMATTQSCSYAADIAANSYFDPCNMTGYTAIAAGSTVDAETPAFVMKNTSTGEYGIYTFSRYEAALGDYDDDWNWIETTPAKPASAKMYYAIPSEGKALLDQAVSIFFATNQSILYVATPTGIYTINFAGSSAIVNTTPVYTPDAGETISVAKLYLQGVYNVDYSCFESGYYDELALNKKAVVVATQSDTYDGKISVVPMTQIGTGRLDKGSALTYTGFGKILDFCTTGY